MREPKESPWKITEPRSFRSWLKKSMRPLGYDKALKQKQSLAVAYFFASFITFNTVIWSLSKHRESMQQAAPEHDVMQQYLASTPLKDPTEAYIFTYENLEFKGAEHISQAEMEKRRRE